MSHTRNSNEEIPQEDNYTFPQHICCPVVVAGNGAEVSRVQEVIQEKKKKAGCASVEHGTLCNPQSDAPMLSGVKEPSSIGVTKQLNMFSAFDAPNLHCQLQIINMYRCWEFGSGIFQIVI